jgi:anti-anti-sigma factor
MARRVSDSRLSGNTAAVTSPAAIGVHDVEQGIVAVELIGDLDVSAETLLTTSIRTALNRDDNVIVDMCRATFMDVAIARSLLRGHAEACAQGSMLVLQLATAHVVERVVELTRLDEVVPRVSTRVEAIGAIKAGELGSFAAGLTPGQAAR